MQRGILNISNEELKRLIPIIDMERFRGLQLFEKLNSALSGNNENIQILLSEDELEKILDEVGPPISDDEKINSAIKKISELLLSFRQ